MKGQDNLQSASVKIHREVNIYINFWTKFPLIQSPKIQPSAYSGYQRFFSRAAGIFVVGRRPTTKTALEKFLAPRVPSKLEKK